MSKYFVILSEGAYSDCDPEYWMGDTEITQKDLTARAESWGDYFEGWWKSLPERPVMNRWSGKPDMHKYDPRDTEQKIISHSDVHKKWKKKMVEWLETLGYEQLPLNIPEINTYYDVPTSKEFQSGTKVLDIYDEPL